MPKYMVRGTGQQVTLDKGNFRAQGGEGSIHVVGDTVYKICEKGKMIPDGKFQELAVLNHKRIIKPEAVILDSRQKPVGYTMRLVPGNAVPLAQILTKTYREREGVEPKTMAELVRQIADGIRHIHSHKGYLQVDGNEFNYMVTDDHKEVYFIDVNSYQTPHYPADAIMPSIRDWNVPHDPSTGLFRWSELTDWYSFAVISWYMFTAIHPFKGRHPKFPDIKTAMVDQMRAGVSVLNPECQYPKGAVYHPFEDVIPGGKNGAYMQWYRAVLGENKRMPAPADFQAALAFVVTVKEVIGSNNFDIEEVCRMASQIVGYYEKGGREVIVTTDKLYVQNQPRTNPSGRFRVGFTTTTLTPVALVHDKGRATLYNLDAQKWLDFDNPADEIMSCEGRLYTRFQQQVYEVNFAEYNGNVLAMQKPVAQVMPEATKFYQGVALQDMFGARIASVFPQPGIHRQIKIDELSKQQIVDAKYERNVLMVLCMDPATGNYNRFVFRFSKSWDSYDVRKVENVTAAGINFTVLDNGVAVCVTEEEKVEIFSSQKDSPSVKSISDPAIKANMRLCHRGSQVRFAHGERLYNISVRK